MDHGFDWGQIIFVIVAVGIGFIQWVYNLIQQRGGSADQDTGGEETEDPEIRRMREEAWRRQTREPSAPPAHRPPPVPSSSSWGGTLRDVFEEIQRTAEEAQHKPKPPPVPGTVRADLEAPPPAKPVPVLSKKQLPPNADELAQRFETQSRLKRRSEMSASAPRTLSDFLQSDLRHPAALRQAIVLREILGPPKALQTSGDLLF